MSTIGECELCSHVRKVAPVKDHVICEQCYHAVIEILLSMLSNRELWELVHQRLNVSPPVITETTGSVEIKPVLSGYTEPDAPAEPSRAQFRRRSHKNLG